MTRLTERFDEALQLAAQLHRDQKRKGTQIPYVSHLLGVASITLELGGDEDQAIAALLHDAVEDQGGQETAQLIRKRFGDRVAGIVLACSDSEAEPKPPWKDRKLAYLEAMETKPEDALLVTLADKTHNARCIVQDLNEHGPQVWDRFNAREDGTKWYYASLADKFDRLLGGAGAGRFRAIVEDMQAF